MQKLVAIVCGSKNDLPVLEGTQALLTELGISYEVTVASAHRTPERVSELCRQLPEQGTRVVIAAAGHAAHLAGVVASQTLLPVIGVPIPSSDLNGLDSLLAMVQMPGGVPVAVMALGKAGAKNAAIFAAQILAGDNPEIAAALAAHRQGMANAGR